MFQSSTCRVQKRGHSVCSFVYFSVSFFPASFASSDFEGADRGLVCCLNDFAESLVHCFRMIHFVVFLSVVLR